MLTFAYSARDSAGKTISGVQEALNEDNAINTLMTRGLMVLSIQQRAASKSLAPRGKITETDLVLFTRQLATMVDAGLPLVTGLTALFEQADPKKQAGLRRIVGVGASHSPRYRPSAIKTTPATANHGISLPASG